MAIIREKLELEDAFSKAFSQFIKLANQSNVSMSQLKKAAQQTTQTARVFTAALNVESAASKASAAAIKEQTAQLKLQEAQFKKTGSAASSFGTILRNFAGAYFGFQTVQTLVNWSDQLVSSKARLQQVTGSAEAAAVATDKIYAAAMRSRSSFTDMSASVARLATLAGSAFSSIDEAIQFAETFNKQMVLSGASTMEASAAMYQLSQAMASGRLQGDELRSIFENAPMVAQTIATYLGVSVGEVREMASQGLITADIVKNAMLNAAEETDAAFKQMPLTWGQVWTMAQNIAMRALNPVLMAINFLANNIQIIGPAVLGLAAAFAVFQIAAHSAQIAAVATGAYSAAVALLKFAYAALTRQTTVLTAAQMAWNATMLANPITWVIILIVALVAAIYAGVAAFNKFAGASISATGIIAGAFFALVALLYNIFVVPIMNVFIALGNFFSNVFKDPLASVQVLFADMAMNVISIMRSVAKGIEDLINNIPGVEFHLMSGTLDNVYNEVSRWRQEKIDNSGYEVGKELLTPMDLTKAAQNGYNWGQNLESGVASFFTGGNSSLGISGSGAGIDSTSLAGDVGDIAKGVSDINKAVNMSEEDIKSLVDIAERRYVNNINLTSQTPVITVNGQNTGNTAADRQNLANTIRDILIEQTASGTVRSTARAF